MGKRDERRQATADRRRVAELEQENAALRGQLVDAEALIERLLGQVRLGEHWRAVAKQRAKRIKHLKRSRSVRQARKAGAA